MSTVNFPNGTYLQSSALTPDAIEGIFQTVTANILGFDLTANPPAGAQAGWYNVRVGWQERGQPAWKINEDVCVITAYPLDEAYSQVRDQQTNPNDSTSLDQNMCYTQVWKIHWTLYGPNCYDHARLIVSSMSLDWVHDYLQNPPPPANTAIYAIAEWARPRYAPELFQGQWWKRADVDLRFNEKVLEDTTVASALTSQVTITADTGQVEVVNMSAS